MPAPVAPCATVLPLLHLPAQVGTGFAVLTLRRRLCTIITPLFPVPEIVLMPRHGVLEASATGLVMQDPDEHL